MKKTKELIELVDSLISNLDPTPIIVNGDFPLRWESNVFLQDYDFSENYLDLDEGYERSNGKYLRSVGTAIEINQDEDGSFEFRDGVFMLESHAWCSRLNSKPGLPTLLLINERLKNFIELRAFLVKTYS